MVRRGLVLTLLLGGCGDDPPAVRVIAHTNAAVVAPGIEITAYDADGVPLGAAVTDADGVVALDVPEGGAVAGQHQLVTAVSPGDVIVIGPTFARTSTRGVTIADLTPPPDVLSTRALTGCGDTWYVTCPGADDAADLVVMGYGPTPAAYAYVLGADPDEPFVVGAWQDDATLASLAYVDPVGDDEAFTMRVFAATERTYGELQLDAIDPEAHVATVSLPTAFLDSSAAWTGLVGGDQDGGWDRMHYHAFDGAFGDLEVTADDLPPRIDLTLVGDLLSWEPPDDVSGFDVLVIEIEGDVDESDDDRVIVLPPETASPVRLPAPEPNGYVYLTYEGYDTVDGYADVKARGYDAVALAPKLDRARDGAIAWAWLVR